MTDQDIRDELVSYLEEGNAHAPLTEAVRDLPAGARARSMENLPYTIWELIEHIRIAQWDIVSFCRGPQHESPPFPDGYWPEPQDSVSDAEWRSSLKQIQDDREAMVDLLQDPDRSLTDPFEWGTGQTLLHEAQLLVDHRSYHTGQVIVLRRLQGNWSSD
jgi:uncharacterized damage-inducible protein DinB